MKCESPGLERNESLLLVVVYRPMVVPGRRVNLKKNKNLDINQNRLQSGTGD